MLKILNKFVQLITRSTNELYYINGPDVLPQPLDQEEESRMIELKDSDPTIKGVLVEHNLRLVVYIAKKFENTGVGIEDLISIGTIGLIKAINTFKSDKNIKLATYASRCIENEILMYIRKSSNQRSEMSIDEPLNTDWDGNELLLSDILGGDEDSVYRNLETDEERRIVTDAVSTLCERDREIISLRFALGRSHELTQKEVAEKLGISQSYISRLEKKIIDKLKRDLSAKV